MSPKNIYFSHSVKTYNTEKEKEQLNLIQTEFPKAKIINPADFQESWKKLELTGSEIMEKCFDLVRESHIVVFSALKLPEIYKTFVTDEEMNRYYVGRGVFDEVKLAEKNNKEIYLINNSKIEKNYTLKLYNTANWSTQYGIVNFNKDVESDSDDN